MQIKKNSGDPGGGRGMGVGGGTGWNDRGRGLEDVNQELKVLLKEHKGIVKY